MYIRDKDDAGSSNKERCESKKNNKKRIKCKHILYRIGEASNPGPSHKGCHSKQRKLGDFPISITPRKTTRTCGARRK
eukprot:11732163-Heterocapsa_arctica.AAC.1